MAFKIDRGSAALHSGALAGTLGAMIKSRIWLMICAVSFIATGFLALLTIDPAFKHTTNWDTYPIPEVAQSFIEFSDWVVGYSILVFAIQVVGLTALLQLKKKCGS